MLSNYIPYLTITILFILYPIVFIIGYILGKMHQSTGVYTNNNQIVSSKYNQQNNTNQQTIPIVAIDDRKLVVATA